MDGASIALGASLRSARCSRAGSEDRLPVGHSSWTIWIPLQYEPNTSHGVPAASSTTPGSMALKLLAGTDRTTLPWSTQR